MSATESTEPLAVALSRVIETAKSRMSGDEEAMKQVNYAVDVLAEYLDKTKDEGRSRQWVMRAVVINNGHLPQDDFDRLRNSFDEEFIDVQNFHDGMIVYTGEDVDSIDEDYPEDLQNCVRWAIEQGFTHVRFDPDGEVIPELTDYGW
jgi:hypothetical protein